VIGPSAPIVAPDLHTRAATLPERALRCARCDHALTREEARVTRGGAHRHTRLNPFGYVHDFGCFAPAEGCATVGPSTEEHTWFPGYAWTMARCGACGAHVGWRFEGAGDAFWGLLTEMLR
jgi:hypothetical protein